MYSDWRAEYSPDATFTPNLCGSIKKRPVNALVCSTCVTQASTVVQSNGVVLGGAEVLEINALFYYLLATVSLDPV